MNVSPILKNNWITPFAEKDRLLRNDNPKVEHPGAMSETESHEKMVLWKLRCSATKQKSSNKGVIINGQGKENEDVEKFCVPFCTYTYFKMLA